MKTYEEKAQSVLNKIEEEKEIKRKRNRTITKVVTPIMSFCFVALIAVGAMNSGLMKQVPVQTDKGEITSPATEQTPENDLQSGENNNVSEQTPTKNPQQFESSNGAVDNSNNDICDMLGTIEKDGMFYVQVVDADASAYSKGVYLGKASDYEGCYKNYADIDGDLYQSAEDETILLVFLENGATIVLREDPSVDVE